MPPSHASKSACAAGTNCRRCSSRTSWRWLRTEAVGCREIETPEVETRARDPRLCVLQRRAAALHSHRPQL
eukprot:scaffold77238_cov60-Phaeocystis_antarctica.AAC.4